MNIITKLKLYLHMYIHIEICTVSQKTGHAYYVSITPAKMEQYQ